MTRTIAILATAAALAASALSPATAAAQDAPSVCYDDINIPSCVNWVFDTLQRVPGELPDIPPEPGQTVVPCIVLEIATGRDCPYWPPPSA